MSHRVLFCRHHCRGHAYTSVLISESVHEGVKTGQSLQFLAAPACCQLPRKLGPSSFAAPVFPAEPTGALFCRAAFGARTCHSVVTITQHLTHACCAFTQYFVLTEYQTR